MRMRYFPHGKRLLDIVLSLSVGIIFLPLLMLLGVVVLLAHGRPIFFSQTRIGLLGKPFILHKMRSMEDQRNNSSSSFSPGKQRLITPVGRFMRSYKLDEFPQLWNVLKGDMSLVGPRPETPQWVISDDPDWSRVLEVRPGMTDRASIKYRNEEAVLASVSNPLIHYKDEILPDKLAIGRRYVENVSLREDLRVLALTILTVLNPAASTQAASSMDNS